MNLPTPQQRKNMDEALKIGREEINKYFASDAHKAKIREAAEKAAKDQKKEYVVNLKNIIAAKDKQIADLKEKLEKVEQWAKTEEPVSQHDKEDVLFTLGFNNAKIVLLSQILKSK